MDGKYRELLTAVLELIESSSSEEYRESYRKLCDLVIPREHIAIEAELQEMEREHPKSESDPISPTTLKIAQEMIQAKMVLKENEKLERENKILRDEWAELGRVIGSLLPDGTVDDIHISPSDELITLSRYWFRRTAEMMK